MLVFQSSALLFLLHSSSPPLLFCQLIMPPQREDIHRIRTESKRERDRISTVAFSACYNIIWIDQYFKRTCQIRCNSRGNFKAKSFIYFHLFGRDFVFLSTSCYRAVEKGRARLSLPIKPQQLSVLKPSLNAKLCLKSKGT